MDYTRLGLWRLRPAERDQLETWYVALRGEGYVDDGQDDADIGAEAWRLQSFITRASEPTAGTQAMLAGSATMTATNRQMTRGVAHELHPLVTGEDGDLNLAALHFVLDAIMRCLIQAPGLRRAADQSAEDAFGTFWSIFHGWATVGWDNLIKRVELHDGPLPGMQIAALKRALELIGEDDGDYGQIPRTIGWQFEGASMLLNMQQGRLVAAPTAPEAPPDTLDQIGVIGDNTREQLRALRRRRPAATTTPAQLTPEPPSDERPPSQPRVGLGPRKRGRGGAGGR